MRDVRRKRHLTELIQDFFKNAFIGEFDQAVSFFHHAHNFTDEKAFSKIDPGTDAAFFAGFYQSFPDIVLTAL